MNNYVVGLSRVRVMRKFLDERNGREEVTCVHQGVIVKDMGKFVKVFNNLPVENGGDISPYIAESFPVEGKLMWVEDITPLKRPLNLPADL
jgi:hypothetical protein